VNNICWFLCGYILSVAPKISRPPLSIRVTEKETAMFDCRVIATAYPVTVITWTKDEETIDVRIYIQLAEHTVFQKQYYNQQQINYFFV